MIDFADALAQMDYDGEKIILPKMSKNSAEYASIDEALVAAGCERTKKHLEYIAPGGKSAEDFLRDSLLDIASASAAKEMGIDYAVELFIHVIEEDDVFHDRGLRIADPLCASGVTMEAMAAALFGEGCGRIHSIVGMDPKMKNLRLASDRLAKWHPSRGKTSLQDIKLIKGSHLTRRLKRVYDLAILCVPEYRDLLHIVEAWNIVVDGGLMIAVASEATIERMVAYEKSDLPEIGHINSRVRDVLQIDNGDLAIIIDKD